MMRWVALGLWLGFACGCGDDDSAGPSAAGKGGGSSESAPDATTAGHDAGSAGRGGKAGSGAQQPGEDEVAAIELGGDLGKPKAQAKWTVFIYGHADHSLSNSFVRDLVEMARADLDDDVRVIVLADFDASQELADSGERFPSGAQWLRIPGGGAEPETLAVEDELDFDDPSVLAGAVATAFKQFPAQHHAVVLWDHGGSWSGGFGGDSQNGTRAEPTPMTTVEVAQAVQAGVHAAKLGDDAPLDIFSFDTCLMAGAEVAWEFRDLAQVYIANAEIDYGDGWDYTSFLGHLAQHPDDPVRELATTEVEMWDAHHVGASFNDALLRSHVAIDTSGLPGLATTMGTLVDVWKSSNLGDVELGRAAYFSQPPYMNQLENPQAAPELRDLGQFLLRLQGVSDRELANAADGVSNALQDAIIARSQGSLRTLAAQLGVHIELPLAANLNPKLFDAYAARAGGWSLASRWGEALRAYGKADDGGAPELSASISNDQMPDAAHLPTVEFSVTSADVAEVDVELATVDPSKPDELVFFGVVAKSPIDAGTIYDFSWNGQLTALPDGHGDRQAIYVSVWEDVGPDAMGTAAPVLATFGLVETSDGATALGALLFQDGDEGAGLLTLLDPPVTMTLAEVTRDLPGSTFTPVLVTLATTSGEQSLLPGSPIPIDAETIPISQGPAGTGRYALVTTVNDVFGNAAADALTTDVVTPIEPP